MKKLIHWLSERFQFQSPCSGDINADNIQAKNVVSGTQINLITDKENDDRLSLRHSYLNKIMSSTGILPLEGIDPKSDDHLSLSAVYTALLTMGSDHDRTGETVQDMREASRISALEYLNRHQHMVLLGDPGSGKTTFINFTALCLAGENLGNKNINLELLTKPLPDKEGKDTEEAQAWDHGPLIPVRVILRDFAAKGLTECTCAADLWKFVREDLKNNALEKFFPHLERELRETGGLIMLDGLDEVPEAENLRLRIIKVVEDFKSIFPKCRVLLTSRTYAYQKQSWRIPGFSEAVLAPFSKGQIIRFISCWYAHIAGQRGWNAENQQGKAELLKRAVMNSDRLRGLSERPILLTLMAILHAGRGGSLPDKREELYAETVDMLLNRWESEKIIRDNKGNITSIEPSLAEFLKADKDRIRRVLDELAYNAHASQPDIQGTADISEKDLVYELINVSSHEKSVNPKELIRFLNVRAGLLLPRGVGVHTFPHRTFQEYLAACHLTNLDFPDQVAELAKKEPDRWREVALLAGAKAAGGASSNIWSLAEACCYKDPDAPDIKNEDFWGALLAGQALVETGILDKVSPRNQAKLKRICQWQVKIIEGNTLPAVERAAAGRHLAVLGDPRKEVVTLEHMEFCLVPAGDFNMGDGDEKHLNKYLNYDYHISRHPVTNAQFDEFVKAGGYANQQYWKEAEKAEFWKAGKFKGSWDNDPRSKPYNHGTPFNLSNHPVVGVSWYEALAFTLWLTDLWRGQGIIDENRHICLPSEAEWEKAARGGLVIPDFPGISCAFQKAWDKKVNTVANQNSEREYPWGNEQDREKANFGETGIGTTSSAGCFSAGVSSYGCLDMSGNVYEWTRSLWGKNFSKPDFKYPYEPNDGREDKLAKRDICRVVRGGAFFYDSGSGQCAARDGGSPDSQYYLRGFRVLCAPNSGL